MSEANPFQNLVDSLSSITGQDTSEWWGSFSYPDTPRFDIHNLISTARSALFAQALTGKHTVKETYLNKDMFSLTADQVHKHITAYIKNELSGTETYTYKANKKIESFYVFSGGAIFTTLEDDIKSISGMTHTFVGLSVVGTTETHMQMANDIIETLLQQDVRSIKEQNTKQEKEIV
jgi:hypothetical protein